MKFKSEIVKLFTYLPHKQRCNILNDLVNVTKCDSVSIARTLVNNNIIRNPQKIKCSFSRASKCTGSNVTEVVLEAFWNQMGKLFHVLPVPFQCSIVNKISSSSPSSKRRKLRQSPVLKGKTPRITLQLVERQLEKVYPSLNITQKCSKVWTPLKKKVPLKSPASLVNITVQLTRGMRRKTWVKRLRRKAYQIYNIYYRYTIKEQRKRPVSLVGSRHSSGPPLLSKREVRVTVIRMTKISRSVVAVVFALEAKKPGSSHFSKISSAKEITKAINATGNVAMRRLFDAKVLELTVAKADKGHTDSIWTGKDMVKANLLFPRYLISYYRLGIDRLARCLVMLYISSNLQRDLRPVEMYYNSQKYLPKKYFCSSTRRPTLTNVSVTSFYMTNETEFFPRPKGKNRKKDNKGKINLIDKINERMNVTISIPSSESTEDFEEEEEDGNDEEEVEQSSTSRSTSPLEIGLLALLALLCVAILAFTIHCVIFALKKRAPPPSTDQQSAKTEAFELFRKIEESKILAKNEPNQALPKVEVGASEPKSITTPNRYHPSKPRVMVEEERKTDSQELSSNQNVYSIDPLCSEDSSKDTEKEDSQKSSHSDNDDDDENHDTERGDDHADVNDGSAHDGVVDSIDDGAHDCVLDSNDDGDGVHKDNDDDDEVFLGQISPKNTNCDQDMTRNSSIIRNCSLEEIKHDRPRTLKESCGEMKLISDSDNHSKRSLSSSGDLDPVIKNNIMTVVVVFDDQNSERESTA